MRLIRTLLPTTALPATLLPVTLLIAALGGCYAYERGPHRAGPEIPAARVTGPDVSCIPLDPARQSVVRDGRTIDFLSGRRGWRNVLPSDCPGLATERAFTFSTSLSQLCSSDIIRVLANYGGEIHAQAGCGLGQFTPIELAR